MSILSKSYMDNKTKLSMQLLADIIKKLYEQKIITKKDLYNLSEREIIEKIDNCKYNDIAQKFNEWRNTERAYESDTVVNNRYCKEIKTKRRYINPLVRDENKYTRINQISKKAKEDIESCLKFETKKYAYLDFEF